MKKGVLRNLTKVARNTCVRVSIYRSEPGRLNLVAKSIVKFTGRITSTFTLPTKPKFYWYNKSRICFTGRIRAGFI